MSSHQSQVAARYAAILDALATDGRVDVAQVAVRLGVAAETIRRDLRALEVDGKLHRVYGGAVPVDVVRQPLAAVPPGPSVEEADLGFAASLWRRLPKTGTILLSAGPLSQALAQAIVDSPPAHPGLTVVTTSVDAAVALSRGALTLSVYNVGGTVSHRTRGQEGDWALSELGRFSVDLALICPAGVDVTNGLTADTPAAAAVGEASVAAARSVIAMVPCGALGRPAFVRFAELNRVDLIAVAGRPEPAVLQTFQDQAQVEVLGPVGAAPDLSGAARPGPAGTPDPRRATSGPEPVARGGPPDSGQTS